MSTANRKKLLFLITKSNWGGAQRYVYEMATAMQAEYEVAVGSGGAGTMREKLTNANIPTHTVAGWQRNVNPLKELRSWLSLYQLLRQERPDVLHLNSSKAGFSGALVGRVARVPHIVFTIHGWPFLEPRPLWWRALAWCGMYATAVLAHKLIPISQYDIDHAGMPGIAHKYHEVIHNAVPPIAFLPTKDARSLLSERVHTSMASNSLLMISVAELHPKKNLATAILAVASHNRAHPDHPLLYFIIGDGVLQQELTLLIKRLEASAAIHLLGHVTDARNYLKAADIFLLPSFQEGLPYAVLEAGAAGLPTIASNVCGIPEVITHSETGLLFDPTNQADLEQALFTVASDPQLRTRLGTAFSAHIDRHFTIETMTAKTKAAYQTSRL